MATAPVYEATLDNFSGLVLQNSHKGMVLVDFWAPWAGPSLRQRELLVTLANEYAGRFLLVSVNTDEQKQLAREYGVINLPACKLFRNGRVVEEFRGMQPEADYRRVIDQHVGMALDPVQEAAMAAWQQGEPDKAIQLLVDAAMEAPDNLALPLLLAKILMRQGRVQDAHAVLSALPTEAREERSIAGFLAHLQFLLTAGEAPDPARLEQRLEEAPDDLQSRFQLAAVKLLADDTDTALDQLLEIVRRNPGFEDGVARRGLLAVLDMLDPDDARIKQYRAELFNLVH